MGHVSKTSAEYCAYALNSLQQVIDMLETVPAEQFNMQHWWLDKGMAFDDDANKMYKVADGPCGCVIGHLIQRGLLAGDVISAKDMPEGALPYQYADRVWVQISNGLGLYNSKVCEWLFSQYSYLSSHKISKADVISRVRFIMAEEARRGVTTDKPSNTA